MGLRLFTKFTSIAGIDYCVEIHEADYAGAVTEFKCNNFELTYEGESQERFNPILASRMRLNYLVQSQAEEDGFLTDLITSDEDRFTVEIYRDAQLRWRGLVLQDVVQFEDMSFPYYFTLTATDGIGRLRSLDYRPLPQDGAAYSGRQTILEHIYNALREVPTNRLFAQTHDYLHASVSWEFAGQPTGESFLEATRLDHAVFTKTDKANAKVYSSCFDVLFQLCQAFGMRLYFDNGTWQLVQINQYRHVERMLYIYAKNGSQSFAADLAWSSVNNAKCLRGGSFTFLPPLRKVAVAYQHLRPDNLAQNAFFNYQSDNYAPNTRFVFAERVQVDPTENFTIKFRAVVNINTFIRPDQLAQNFGGVYPKHRYKFSLRLSVASRFVKRFASDNFFYGIREDDITFELGGPHNYDAFSSIIDEGKNGVTQQLTIEFETPESPNEGEGVLQFYLNRVTDEFGDNIEPDQGTFHWSMGNPRIKVENAAELDEQSADSTRVYCAEGSTGNSAKLEYDLRLGDGPNVNSISRLTYEDGDTADWTANAGDAPVKVSQLLANEILSGQLAPVRVMQGAFLSAQLSPTQLLLRSGITYVMRGGSLDAHRDTWRGSWFAIGYNQVTGEDETTHGEVVVIGGGGSTYDPDNPNDTGGDPNDPTDDPGNDDTKSAGGGGALPVYEDFEGVTGNFVTITRFELPDPALISEIEVNTRLKVFLNGRLLRYGIIDPEQDFVRDWYIDLAKGNEIYFKYPVTAREYIRVDYILP